MKTKFNKHLVALAIFILLLGSNSTLFARDQITAVGSSTVYPLATIAAETFANKNRNQNFKAPTIEATGTSAGFKLFCTGVGLNTPDMVNASRKIKDSEVNDCKKNGVNDIMEITLGNDAIVLVAPTSMGKINLTTEEIYLAVAAFVPSSSGKPVKNNHKNWQEINRNLPNAEIHLVIPASTHGTFDSFIELAMEPGCKAMIKAGKLKVTKDEEGKVCKSIRSDSHRSTAGDDYGVVLQKTERSANHISVATYSYYDQQKSRYKIDAVSINGVSPNPNSFAKNEYPLFRPLFIYVKRDHMEVIPGLTAFVKEITSENAIGVNGYLPKAGLLPLSKIQYDKMIKSLKI